MKIQGRQKSCAGSSHDLHSDEYVLPFYPQFSYHHFHSRCDLKQIAPWGSLFQLKFNQLRNLFKFLMYLSLNLKCYPANAAYCGHDLQGTYQRRRFSWWVASFVSICHWMSYDHLRNKGGGQILFSSQTGWLQEACSQVGQETALSGPFGLLFWPFCWSVLYQLTQTLQLCPIDKIGNIEIFLNFQVPFH